MKTPNKEILINNQGLDVQYRLDLNGDRVYRLKPKQYSVKLTDHLDGVSYLIYRDRTKWTLRTAKKHKQSVQDKMQLNTFYMQDVATVEIEQA